MVWSFLNVHVDYYVQYHNLAECGDFLLKAKNTPHSKHISTDLSMLNNILDESNGELYLYYIYIRYICLSF